MTEELWVIRGREPVLWTIPCYVKWLRDEGEIYYAVPLMPPHLAAFKAFMDGAARPFNGMWLITPEVLKGIGERVLGEPMSFFSWERVRKELTKRDLRGEGEGAAEFVDALWQQGIGDTREQVVFWYNQFCTQMLDWLANKGRTVDLGFIRLHPTYYRRNWRHTLLSRRPRAGRALTVVSQEKREMMANESGFMDEMMSLDLLAMHTSEGWCYRQLELEFRQPWWKAVVRLERMRLLRLTSFGYARAVMESVRGQAQRMFSSYMQWLAAIARPSATDVEGGYAGQFRLVPNVPPNPVPARGVRTWFVPSVVANKLPLYVSASEHKDLAGTPKELPKVPALRPRESYLREGGGDVPGQSNGETAKPRLLVPDLNKKLNGEQLLAVDGNGGNGGVGQ